MGPSQISLAAAIVLSAVLSVEAQTPPPAPTSGGVIAGRVVDPDRQPVAGADVRATQVFTWNGVRTGRTMSGMGGATTNDRGEYRIVGLSPAEYLVSARAPMGREPAAGRARVFAPTLFPSTTDVAAAAVVTMGSGEERLDVDVRLQTEPVVSVSGVVIGPDGRPAEGVRVMRGLKRPSPFFARTLEGTPVTSADGAFVFSEVPPGDHVLTVAGPESWPGPLWGELGISVPGQNLTSVVITTQPTLTLTGRVVIQGSGAPPWQLDSVRVAFQRTGDDPAGAWGTPMGTVAQDGTLTVKDLIPGSYRAKVILPQFPDAAWVAKSAMLAGRDMLDVRVDVGPGTDRSGLVVTIADAPSSLSGNLTDADGRSTPRLYVLVFPADSKQWWIGSRRVRYVQANDAGAYVIAGLPPGDYRVCALTEVDRQLLYEPAYLNEWLASSIAISIGDRERKIQHLRVGLPRKEP